jgi:hypothetical protein
MRDRSKYCEFHRTYGHTTNGCMQLRDILEEMARNGELQEFTGRQRGQENQRSRENLPQEQQQGHQQNQASPVLFIAGGLGPKKENRKRKSTSQVLQIGEVQGSSGPIQFTDDELVSGGRTFGNALIVSMTMANREVRRIFIDTGAASNILFYDAFIRID